jgi:hypothetical protein
MKEAIIIFVLIGFAIFATSFIVNSDNSDINEFVASRKEKLISSEMRIFEQGPYWCIKNTRVYRVQTDKNIYWLRYGWPLDDQYVEINGQYKKLN